MDVRCERCSTEYELDEDRITAVGVAVRCARCGNTFLVKKKTVAVAGPLPPEVEEIPFAQASPSGLPPMPSSGASGDGVKEWRVRQPNGNLVTVKDLATLQRWIVERKVGRDDEISLNGESWRRLGGIEELSSFFQVVDEARRAAQFLEQPAEVRPTERSVAPQTGSPRSEPGELPRLVPPVAPAGTSPQNPVEAGAGRSQPAGRMPQPSPSSVPSFENFSFRRSEAPQRTAGFETAGVAGSRPDSREPAFTLSGRRGESYEPSDEVIAAAAGVKQGVNRPWSIALLVLVLGAVSYLAYRYFVWMPERQKQEQVESANREAAARAKQGREQAEREQAERERAQQERAQQERAQQERASRARAESRKAEELAKAATSPSAASGSEEKAEAPAPPPKAEPSSTAPDSGESAGRSFDSYMAQGDRLREREQPRNALHAYAKAAEMEPNRAEPFTGRGLALLDLGKTATAIAAFRQALNLDPRYGLALMGLAEAYRLEGNKDEAIRYYERYVSVLPDGPEAPVAKAAIKSLQE